MAEAAFQGKVIRWLKSKGCFVIKTQAGPATPVGTPDLIALFPGGGWCALEIKASAKSKYQPLQKVTIAKLDAMYFSRAVWPENWDEIKKELDKII